MDVDGTIRAILMTGAVVVVLAIAFAMPGIVEVGTRRQPRDVRRVQVFPDNWWDADDSIEERIERVEAMLNQRTAHGRVYRVLTSAEPYDYWQGSNGVCYRIEQLGMNRPLCDEPGADHKHCRSCGHDLEPAAEFCPRCGVDADWADERGDLDGPRQPGDPDYPNDPNERIDD